MKTKKLWMAAMLLSGTFYANAQLVEDTFETGAGLQNGAFNNSFSSTRGAVFFGYRAGFNTTTKDMHGDNNTFIGHESGFSNLAGHDNTFTGWSSGLNNTTGSNNTFFGSEAGANTIGGYSNTFIGRAAGIVNTEGNNNVFVGMNSGLFAQTGAFNTYLGVNAGFSNATGGNNVMVGSNAGGSNLNWANTMVGTLAGHSNVDGYGNVFIGMEAGRYELGSSKLYIANSSTSTPLIYGDFYSNKVGIGGINTYTAPDKFPVTAGGVSVANYTLFVKGGILTEEVRVNLQTGWADYVFENDYNLRPLAEVEQYIAENGHLPNVPSAKQVKEEGIELGDMARIQQEKIEELTLYAIAQDKQIETQNKKLEQQQKEIDELKAAVKALMNK